MLVTSPPPHVNAVPLRSILSHILMVIRLPYLYLSAITSYKYMDEFSCKFRHLPMIYAGNAGCLQLADIADFTGHLRSIAQGTRCSPLKPVSGMSGKYEYKHVQRGEAEIYREAIRGPLLRLLGSWRRRRGNSGSRLSGASPHQSIVFNRRQSL